MEVEKEFENFLPPEIGHDVWVRKLLRVGEPFAEIIHEAREGAVDLIVMATHGRTGISHSLLGSIAEKVVQRASCPVLTIKHADFRFQVLP